MREVEYPVINDNGQIGFWARLDDGTSGGILGLFRADPVVDDLYEENGTIGEAYDISADSQTWLTDLAGYGIQWDDDFYQIEIAPGYEFLNAELLFADADGTLDFELLDSTGAFLTSSTTDSGNELLNLILSAPGTYYLVFTHNVGCFVFALIRWLSQLASSRLRSDCQRIHSLATA